MYFFGTDRIASQLRKYKTFIEAKKFLSQFKFKSRGEYLKFQRSDKSPDDLPNQAQRTYRDQGWLSWGDFLGSGFVHTRDRPYRSYAKVKKYVKKNKVVTVEDWEKLIKSKKFPSDIPSSPRRYKEFKNWGEFTGSGFIATHQRKYRSFKAAKKYVYRLNLKRQSEWFKYCKSGDKPTDIPRNAHIVYAKQWISWGNFLGSGNIANHLKKFLNYNKAKVIISRLGLKSQTHFRNKVKTNTLPDFIPKAPMHVYKNDWEGWNVFLGKKNKFNYNFLSYVECKKAIIKYNFREGKDFYEYIRKNKLPHNIPRGPYQYYSRTKEWKGWADFLGKK